MTPGELILGSLPLILGMALIVVIRRRQILQGIEWIFVSVFVLLASLFLMKALAPFISPSIAQLPASPVSHGGGVGWVVTTLISLFTVDLASYGWPVILADVVVGALAGWGVCAVLSIGAPVASAATRKPAKRRRRAAKKADPTTTA
jgi:hypothetical protein